LSDLIIAVERDGDTVVVRVKGDLDKVSAAELRRHLDGLSAEGHGTVVIDVRLLDFCDSSGLWLLIEHQRLVAGRGGVLRLEGVHGVLRRILDVTGLSAVFPVGHA
jgi:anti-sigma B factor antagonist